ncbi:chemokine XC receptor 1 [Amia ocellicauda]|uniref:chemokine XC receptor 1 n=1 Tax=Amia ocellicauda TaxID=2972642 RepID=UPI0034644D9F
MESLSTTPDYHTHAPDYYDDDYIDDLCHNEGIISVGAVVTTVFFTVVIVLSLLGNLLVLGILIKYENLRSVTNTFILNLALSDLIFTFGLPFWAHYHTAGWTFDTSLCKVISFIFQVGFYSGIIFLTMMTIHRYIAVVHPLYDLGSRKWCYGMSASVIIWIVSFLAALPGYMYHEVQLHDKNMHCEYNDMKWKHIGVYQQNAFFLVALCVIVFCYFQILKTLLRSRTHTRYRTVRLIFIIVVVFFLGWAPYNIVLVLYTLKEHQVHPFTQCEFSNGIDYAFYISRLIAFSHCCLNPVFYAFVGMKFRNHLKKLLRKFWLCQTSEEQQTATIRVVFHSHGEEQSMY